LFVESFFYEKLQSNFVLVTLFLKKDRFNKILAVAFFKDFFKTSCQLGIYTYDKSSLLSAMYGDTKMKYNFMCFRCPFCTDFSKAKNDLFFALCKRTGRFECMNVVIT